MILLNAPPSLHLYGKYRGNKYKICKCYNMYKELGREFLLLVSCECVQESRLKQDFLQSPWQMLFECQKLSIPFTFLSCCIYLSLFSVGQAIFLSIHLSIFLSFLLNLLFITAHMSMRDQLCVYSQWNIFVNGSPSLQRACLWGYKKCLMNVSNKLNVENIHLLCSKKNNTGTLHEVFHQFFF